MIYYVYEHWRPDKDLPFYVGKGKGARAFNLKRKNSFHARIVKKLSRLGMCVEVRMVASALGEVDAYVLEKERIAFWRKAGVELANKTDGGEGFSDPTGEIRARIAKSLTGKKTGPPSIETRAKISEAHKGRIISPEHRARVSAANKTRVISAETGRKISLANTGRKFGPCPEERRAKISAANRNPSAETRSKMRAAKLGAALSEEHKRKIGQSLIGRVVSDETRAKIGAANKLSAANKKANARRAQAAILTGAKK